MLDISVAAKAVSSLSRLRGSEASEARSRGWGGGASAKRAGRVDRFPPPGSHLPMRSDLPRKRERLRASALRRIHFQTAAWLSDTASRSRRMRASCCHETFAPKQRAWGMPGARCTRSRAWCVESTRVSHHGRTGITRHSRTRMVLTVSFALSPVIGLSCHRHLQGTTCKLDAGVEASGPHDFTVRVCAVRPSAHPRPSHPAPNVRDDRETPLMWDGTIIDMEVIWGKREAKYFFKSDWTGGIELISRENFFCRRRHPAAFGKRMPTKIMHTGQ